VFTGHAADEEVQQESLLNFMKCMCHEPRGGDLLAAAVFLSSSLTSATKAAAQVAPPAWAECTKIDGMA
jgi:hypothetical protein